MSGPRPEVARRLTARDPGTRFEPLPGDASTRSFVRIRRGGSTAIVMDYGAPFAGPSDDQTLAEIFLAAGLPVARVLESYPDAGFLLLEDLGTTMLEQVVRSSDPAGPPPSAWLDAARLAARVADVGTPVLAASARTGGPALDGARFRFEMDFFLEHFAAGLRRAGSGRGDELRRALYRLADAAADSPRKVLCHRDFHSRNLMVPPGGALAMVDIQDARWGPDTYDLASLVCDAYVDLPDAWVGRAVEAFRESLAVAPAAGFEARLDRVSAQRMIKALGTFGYQTTRRGSDRYLEPIPRTLERLRRLLPSLEGHEGLFGLLRDNRLLDDF